MKASGEGGEGCPIGLSRKSDVDNFGPCSTQLTINVSQQERITMLKSIHRLMKDEKGAAAVEYALLVVLIALVIWLGASALGNNINNILSTAANNLATQAS